MKIFAVGMNYRKHLAELNDAEPMEPVLFLKPDSAFLSAPAASAATNMPFFLPDFSKEVHYEAEIVVRVCRLGKNIPAKFAYRYYDAVTVGIDMTARDLQRKLRSGGMPWELCKGFDQSAVVGQFEPLEKVGNVQNLNFRLDINGQTVQEGCTADTIFPVDRVVEYASTFFTFRTGDLIFTGTPSGIGCVNINDHLEGYLMGKKVLDLRVK